MGFTVKYPFTFPHKKCIVVILSDQYDDNYVSYDIAERLSKHPKERSFCNHKDGQDYSIWAWKRLH